MLLKVLTSGLLLIALAGSVAAQGCPDPTGVVNAVRVNGQIVEGVEHEFLEDGTWEMWHGDKLVGWGAWELNPALCTIDYVNLSGDGGGGQTGTYTWSDESHEWERTAASNPNAPPMSIVPPL